MDFGPLRSLVRDLNFSAHGLAATVTRPAPDDTPIETRVIWLVPATEGYGGGDLVRREPALVMGIRIDEVPTIPRGTTVVAPEWGQSEPQRWRVDGIDRVEADHTRVFVVPDPEAS